MKDLLDDLEPLEKRLKKKIKELKDVDAELAGIITTFEIEPAEGELLDKYALQLGTSRKVAGMYDGTADGTEEVYPTYETDAELRDRLKGIVKAKVDGAELWRTPIFEDQEAKEINKAADRAVEIYQAKQILKEISKL